MTETEGRNGKKRENRKNPLSGLDTLTVLGTPSTVARPLRIMSHPLPPVCTEHKNHPVVKVQGSLGLLWPGPCLGMPVPSLNAGVQESFHFPKTPSPIVPAYMVLSVIILPKILHLRHQWGEPVPCNIFEDVCSFSALIEFQIKQKKASSLRQAFKQHPDRLECQRSTLERKGLFCSPRPRNQGPILEMCLLPLRQLLAQEQVQQ